MSSSSSSSESEPEQVASPARSSNNSDSEASSTRRNARRAATRTPAVEGGDTSSSESSSDEETKHLKKKPAPKKRRRQSSEDDPYEQYRHLFDTREEYDNCMGKSEKERESIIYERMTIYDDRKTRREIEERLAAQQAMADGSGSGSSSRHKDKKKEKKQRRVSSDSDSDEERKPSRRSSDSELDAEFHHPSEVDKKKKQKQAMIDLANKRKDKEKKEAASKKAALNIDDIFGKGDSDDDSSSSSDSSSNSSRSSSSSRDSSPDGRSSSSQRRYIDDRSVETKDDLIRVRLSRHFLTTIIHTPFFKDVAVGGYVLLRAGHSASSKHDFQILKIIDVVETPKTYSLDNTKTNKGIKTRWGKQEKVYTLQYISNSPWLEDYFLEWKSVTSQEDNLPTMEYVKKKEAEIKKYRNHNWTTKDIDFMVEQKKKHNSSHTNYALKKADLMRQKDAAIQEGNTELVEKLLHEIDSVDSRADALDKQRSGDISAVSWINERNRTMQRDKFFGRNKMDKMFSITDNDDPFTRKKEKMRVVCGTRNNGGDPTEAPEEKPKVEEKPIQKLLVKPTLTPSASNSSLSSMKGGAKEKKSIFELQKSVNVEIDFSLLPKSLPTTSAAPDYHRRTHHNSHGSGEPSSKKSRTSMSLDEYRAMKAKQASTSS